MDIGTLYIRINKILDSSEMTPVRMAKINKTVNNMCWGGCEKGELSYTVGGNAS